MPTVASFNINLFGGESVIVRTNPHIYIGTITCNPFDDTVGDKIYLIQDNSRVHTAGICMKWLYDECINVVYCPSRSLDLNPIEHVRDTVYRR